MSKESKENKEVAVSTYSKEQIIQSKKFKSRVDVLRVILDENKTYTIADVESGRKYSLKEVDAVIDKFMKGKVN